MRQGLNAEKFARLKDVCIPGEAWLAMYFPNAPEPPTPVVVLDGDFRTLICLPTPETDPAQFAVEMGRLKDKGLYIRAGAVWYIEGIRCG